MNSVAADFAKLYYSNPDVTWRNTFWRGIPTLKNPLDLWVYQEIVSETKPDVIIETGTFKGGSAIFLADLCEALDHGVVRSIDIVNHNPPEHNRVSYILGDSIDIHTFRQAIWEAGNKRVMVILDSDHHKDHVLTELVLYGTVVTPGCYMIVEDTQMNGHPVEWTKGEGPMEAVADYLKRNTNFIPDKSREKFYLTFNPSGYLRCV